MWLIRWSHNGPSRVRDCFRISGTDLRTLAEEAHLRLSFAEKLIR